MHFESLVDRIRSDQDLTKEVPGFDPQNGNERAKYLFLMEAPGPKAVRSGMVSFDNPDPSASNMREQLHKADIAREEIAIWNLIPWYLGNADQSRIRRGSAEEVQMGLSYLQPLIGMMSQLQCIILVGAESSKAHIHLSKVTTVRIARCHHTSAQSMNRYPARAEENVEVFRFIKLTT